MLRLSAIIPSPILYYPKEIKKCRILYFWRLLVRSRELTNPIKSKSINFITDMESVKFRLLHKSYSSAFFNSATVSTCVDAMKGTYHANLDIFKWIC